MNNFSLKQLDALDRLSKKIKEVNGDWTPNLVFGNNEYKYYPVFYYNEEGLFSFGRVLNWYSVLAIPAPLLFKNEKDCEKFAKENIELYKQTYTLDNSYKKGDKVQLNGETYELLTYDSGAYICRGKLNEIHIIPEEKIEQQVSITKEQAIQELEKVFNCKVEIL